MLDDKYKLTQESFDESVSDKMTTPNNTCPHCGAEEVKEIPGFFRCGYGPPEFPRTECCGLRVELALIRQQLADKQMCVDELNALIKNGRAANSDQALRIDELGRMLADEKSKREAVEKELANLTSTEATDNDLETAAIEYYQNHGTASAVSRLLTLRTRATTSEARAKELEKRLAVTEPIADEYGKIEHKLTTAEALLTEAEVFVQRIREIDSEPEPVLAAIALLAKIREGRK